MTDREVVRDYLNETVKTVTKFEIPLLNMFDILICPNCKEFNLDEDMVHQKWDLGMHEDKVCPSCC